MADRPALHFIVFRGDEYNSAVRVFGPPDFIHRYWDQRAVQDVAPGDVAVFARGTDQDLLAPYSFNDSAKM